MKIKFIKVKAWENKIWKVFITNDCMIGVCIGNSTQYVWVKALWENGNTSYLNKVFHIIECDEEIPIKILQYINWSYKEFTNMENLPMVADVGKVKFTLENNFKQLCVESLLGEPQPFPNTSTEVTQEERIESELYTATTSSNAIRQSYENSPWMFGILSQVTPSPQSNGRPSPIRQERRTRAPSNNVFYTPIQNFSAPLTQEELVQFLTPRGMESYAQSQPQPLTPTIPPF